MVLDVQCTVTTMTDGQRVSVMMEIDPTNWGCSMKEIPTGTIVVVAPAMRRVIGMNVSASHVVIMMIMIIRDAICVRRRRTIDMIRSTGKVTLNVLTRLGFVLGTPGMMRPH
jgi:hypothetical protein